MKPLLVAILVVAIGGLAFSGYLSYRELFDPADVPQCVPAGEPGTILGTPPCLFGLAMYLLIAVMAALALARRPRTED